MGATIGIIGLTRAQVEAIVQAEINNIPTGDVSESVSTLLSVTGGGSVVFNSGLTNITDVSVYQGTNDITSGVEIDISGTNITISSNNNISNIIIKATGN